MTKRKAGSGDGAGADVPILSTSPTAQTGGAGGVGLVGAGLGGAGSAGLGGAGGAGLGGAGLGGAGGAGLGGEDPYAIKRNFRPRGVIGVPDSGAGAVGGGAGGAGLGPGGGDMAGSAFSIAPLVLASPALPAAQASSAAAPNNFTSPPKKLKSGSFDSPATTKPDYNTCYNKLQELRGRQGAQSYRDEVSYFDEELYERLKQNENSLRGGGDNNDGRLLREVYGGLIKDHARYKLESVATNQTRKGIGVDLLKQTRNLVFADDHEGSGSRLMAAALSYLAEDLSETDKIPGIIFAEWFTIGTEITADNFEANKGYYEDRIKKYFNPAEIQQAKEVGVVIKMMEDYFSHKPGGKIVGIDTVTFGAEDAPNTADRAIWFYHIAAKVIESHMQADQMAEGGGGAVAGAAAAAASSSSSAGGGGAGAKETTSKFAWLYCGDTHAQDLQISLLLEASFQAAIDGGGGEEAAASASSSAASVSSAASIETEGVETIGGPENIPGIYRAFDPHATVICREEVLDHFDKDGSRISFSAPDRATITELSTALIPRSGQKAPC
jgi:hypothetical protein